MPIDPSNAVRVELHGRTTPAYLRDLGPATTSSDVDAFEQGLGYPLPAVYREFLLRYNGGCPVVGSVGDRDEQPGSPYRHGGTLSMFYKLNGLHDWDRLVPSKDHPWELPSHLLIIGCDAFGNALALDLSQSPVPVLFLDHEEYLDNYAPSVMADDFADLLNRVVTVEEANREIEERNRTERARIVHGAFPAWFTAGTSALAETLPDLPLRFRTLWLEIFDKSLLRIDAYERTNYWYLFMDVCAWIRQSQKLVPPIYIQSVHDIIGRWMKSSNHELGVNGYAPDVATDWLADREARGWLTRDQYFVYLTDEGIRQAHDQLLKYSPADPNPPGLWTPG